MVLAIDIGNTTIAFTGLEMKGSESSFPHRNTVDSFRGSPGSREDREGTADEIPGPGPVDFDIIFSEKIPTETGKDTSVFLREAGRVLGRHAITVTVPDPEDSSARKELQVSRQELPDSRQKLQVSRQELPDSRQELPVSCQELPGSGEDSSQAFRQESSQYHGGESGQSQWVSAVITAVAISSVVPACTPAAEILAEKVCENPPIIINWKCNTGLSFENIPVPDRVGADRVADAAWAAARYPLPVMTVDMGTATTINIVSTDRKFLGGMIGAGVRTALHSLRTGTAQLPELLPGPVPPEKLIGTDTSGCMLSAAVVGTAAMVDGLAGHVEEQIGSPLTLILTGGNASAVSEWICHSYVLEPGLAAKGSALIALRELSLT